MMENKGTYKIRVTVINKRNDQGVANLRVEGWDKDLIVSDLLGSAYTDKNGCCLITFDRSNFQELFFDRQPDVFFKVFKDDCLIRDTRDSLICNLEKGEHEIVIEVDLPTKDIPTEPRPWDKEQVLALHNLADSTPVDVRSSNPDLYRQLEAKILAYLREVLSDHLTEAAEELQQHFRELDLAQLAVQATPIKDYLRSSLQGKDVPETLRREGLIRIGDLKISETFADILKPDVPIRQNTLFQPELQQAATYRLSDFTQLDDVIVQRLIDEAIHPDTLTNEKLKTLIEDNVLSEDLGRELGLNANLYLWTSGHMSLMDAIKRRAYDIQGAAIRNLRDVARLFPSRRAVTAFLEESDITLPEGVSRDETAAALFNPLQRLFPHEIFKTQYQPPESDVIERDLGYVAPLFAQNPGLFSGDTRTLNLEGLKGALLETALNAFDKLKRIVNRYPGLNLSTVLDDVDLSPQEKVTEVTRRVNLISRFYAQNSSAPFLTMSYLPDSDELNNLNFTGINANDREMILAAGRAHERMTWVTQSDMEHAIVLMEAGYHAAADVLRDSEKTFLANTQLDYDVARYIRHIAGDIVVADVARLGTFVEATFGNIETTPSIRTSEEIGNYLRSLPGYSELVGQQDYCRCEDCQSIISPAAYFVDLMEFVETHITVENFATTKPKAQISLWQRRRDLWEMPLTCECGTTLEPYLTIINEILENYSFRYIEGLELDSTLPDRPNIENIVYRSLYESEEIRSFWQPFMLPLERLTVYLSHFPITRAEIASTVLEYVDDTKNVVPQAILGMSNKEYDLVLNAEEDALKLQRLYGLEALAGQQDAQLLLKSMGATRDELTQLIATQFVQTAGKVHIQGAKRNPGSVQNDVEYIWVGSSPAAGLTAAVLDRMHRFIRLWRKLPWSIGELDLILEAHTSLIPTSQDLNLSALSSLLSIQQRFKLSAEELCALIDVIPSQAAAAGQRTMMDRLFNLSLFAREPTWPANEDFTHPAFSTADPSHPTPETLKKQQRLLAGLNIDDEKLVMLIRHWRQSNALNPEGSIVLDTNTLSALYRHARLASLLRLTVPDLLQLLALADDITANRVENLSDLQALITFYNWWKSTRYTLDDLAIITGKTPRNTKAYPLPAKLLDRLLQRAKENRALVFADTIFALINGVTEDQSRQIVALNAQGYFVLDATGIPTVPASVLHDLGLVDQSSLDDELGAWLTAHQRTTVPAFLGDALAGIQGLTATHSRMIMDANPSIFERVTPIFASANINTYRLAAGADISALSLGSVTGTLPPNELLAALQNHLTAFQEPGAPEFSNTVFAGVGGLTDEDSQVLFRANQTLFEEVVDDSLFWLTEDFSQTTPIIVPAGIPLPQESAKTHVMQFYVGTVVPALFAGILDVSLEKLNALMQLADHNFTRGNVVREWVRLFQGKSTSSTLPLEFIEQLQRLSRLFVDRVFTADALVFVRESSGSTGAIIPVVRPLRTPSIADVQILSHLSHFLAKKDVDLEHFAMILGSYDSTAHSPRFAESDEVYNALVQLFEVERPLLAALNRTVPLPGDDQSTTSTENRALEALHKLDKCIKLARYLGTGAEVLAQIAGYGYEDDYEALDSAADALYAAFRIKYVSEAEWKTRIEPFEDRLRERRRDALSDYILRTATPDEVTPDRFQTTNDLYHWFLIDTELEGCARTSRCVAAISSLQLYVQRCIMNLEQSNDGLHVRINPDMVIQWQEWRKNFRVWQANRKVFLWPENYIEPQLRDNITSLFDETISTLLQQDINAQTVLDAYAKYMTGFDEIARLKIAGAYHDRPGDPDDKNNLAPDILHLFGVTSSEPPVYYYRTVENIYLSQRSPSVGVIWNSWRKVDVQIPVRDVSPVVYNNNLYVFWVEIVTKPKNEIIDGSSRFSGYSHKMYVKFTSLRLDNTWSPPQQITLVKSIIDDPLYNTAQLYELEKAIKSIEVLESNLPAPFITYYLPTNFYSIFLDEIIKALKRNTQLIHLDSYTIEVVGIFESKVRVEINLTSPEFRALLHPHYEAGNKSRLKTQYLHWEAKEDYTLRGSWWKRVFPDIDTENRLVLIGQGLSYEMDSGINLVDLRNGSPRSEIPISENRFAQSNIRLRLNFPSLEYGFPYRGTGWYAKSERIFRYIHMLGPLNSPKKVLTNVDSLITYRSIIVNGSLTDAVIDNDDGDLFYLHHQENLLNQPPYAIRRIGTTISEDMRKILFSGGVSTLLNISTQETLREKNLTFDFLGVNDFNYAQLATDRGMPDFTGSLGVHFRETFFHGPFMLANHLNSQGKFAEAQHWYHHIFDPTFNENLDDDSTIETNRVWQYVELSHHNLKTLHEQLQDKEAVELYARDPFNPHAIARLRLGAYKKAVLMKYIDNLLDWGDHLFAQDTMESINEATLLYVMASDLLGERPPELGNCQPPDNGKRTYQDLQIQMRHCSLAETENVSVQSSSTEKDYELNTDFLISPEVIGAVKNASKLNISIPDRPTFLASHRNNAIKDTQLISTLTLADFSEKDLLYRGDQWKNLDLRPHLRAFIISNGTSLRRQACTFCIPPNKELLGYWDRVEDRLFKIRNCMNFSGIRRQLSLFTPEINPQLLVRAKAAGLSLEDVLDNTNGNLPPYRFSFLLVKAKESVGALQAFGATLLSALEKKDAEELAQIRLTQQQNILNLTSLLRDLEVGAKEASLEVLKKRRATIQNKLVYFENLIDSGLNAEEAAQLGGLSFANELYMTALGIDLLAAALHLIPELGAPTALKFGGKQLGDSSTSWSGSLRNFAAIRQNEANLAGIRAGQQRRLQSWEFSLQQADGELKEIEQQIVTAEIHKSIAERSREIHEMTMNQLDETAEFYRDKFSSLGLYTWLSTTLQRLYRQAYQNALSIARLAERAFRFERGDDTTPLLHGNYWNGQYGGLLAGEQLMNDLRQMERLYMETNYRRMEVDQAFSLTQIDPAALLKLKTTGECSFTVPELYFDLFYPGQYRRCIKSARLTIPCITGPYTNVSSTLSLTGSQIRKEPRIDNNGGNLLDVPPTRTVTIATSTAQNDSGVFQLDFRDERYMPFEGAGAANSRWHLCLPKNFKPFDYDTINDVILHISYTAEYDGALREQIEGENQHLETLFNTYNMHRLFSLRQEFSTAFHQLLHSPEGTDVRLELSERHFPLFFQGKQLEIINAKIVMEFDEFHMKDNNGNSIIPEFKVTLEGNLSRTTVRSVTPDTEFAMLSATIHPQDGESIFQSFHPLRAPLTLRLTVDDAGTLAPTNPLPGDSSAWDENKVKDVYIYMSYRVATN